MLNIRNTTGNAIKTATSMAQVSSFCIDAATLRNVLIFICNNIIAYSKRAPNTKNMQQITQDCMAFSPSALGEFVVVVLKMFTYRGKYTVWKIKMLR